MQYIWLIHLFCTVFMTGLIWMVQIVHYPLMNGVGNDFFVSYESRHTQAITWIVLPAMLLELGTAFLLLFVENSFSKTWLVTAFVLLITIWASTFFLQVPLHVALSQGFETDTHQKLVQTNWVRTIAWTLRSGIVLFLTAQILSLK